MKTVFVISFNKNEVYLIMSQFVALHAPIIIMNFVDFERLPLKKVKEKKEKKEAVVLGFELWNKICILYLSRFFFWKFETREPPQKVYFLRKGPKNFLLYFPSATGRGQRPLGPFEQRRISSARQSAFAQAER